VFGQGAAALGKGLADVFAQNAQRQALTDSANMPPEQQAQFLMQKLGPKGAEFVNQLMHIKSAEAEIARSTAETKRADVLMQSDEFKVAHQQEMLDEQKKLNAARIGAERASAAGSGAAAAMHMQQIKESQFRLEQLQKTSAFEDVMRTQMMQDLAGSSGGQSSGTPRVQPQSQEGQPPAATPIPTDVSGASERSVSTQGDEGATPPSGQTDSGDQSIEKTLALIHSFEQGGDPTQGQALKPVALTVDQKREILAHMVKNDFAGAMKVKNEAQLPTRTEKRDIGGTGFEAEFAMFPNGTQQMVPGSLQDKRKPADQQLRQMAGGALLWSQSNDILKSLSNADPDSSGSDVLGNAAVKRLDSLLQRAGMQPIGGAEVRSYREAYTAISQHNVFALRSLLGSRAAQQLVNQLQDMSAKPTDTKEIRNAKFKATEITAETFIKNEVETSIAGKQQVPPALLQVYEKKGLDRRSMDSLQREYLDTFKGLGMKPPPLPGGESGDVSRNTSAGAEGDMVTIGKQSFSRADAEKAAKAHGLTLDELIQNAQ